MKSIKEFERRVAQSVLAREAAGRPFHGRRANLDDLDQVPPADRTAMAWAVPEPAVPGRGYGRGTVLADDAFADYPGGSADEASATEDRTSQLINHGRRSAYHPGLVRRHKVAFGAAATALALLITLATVLVSGGASWPASVTTMQPEITTACQNPDVASEPGQVNFACAKGTQQILWVFALLASSGSPQFADSKTGRIGLEPIAPAQGAEVAWSLNLHHPYNPVNPIDSLQVAARAINNIIGGASAIGANGSPSVQPGLESEASNCLRYTGSTALSTRAGFPTVCSQPITTSAQQAALVADVYKKWAGSPTDQAAQDAALLFENAGNPGDPRVQAILRNLAQTNL